MNASGKCSRRSAGSGARSSRAWVAFRRFSRPWWVKSRPLRAQRVGRTQSNMSTPAPTETTRSTGVPTPMRYRGLSAGRSGATSATEACISSGRSPTEYPPSA